MRVRKKCLIFVLIVCQISAVLSLKLQRHMFESDEQSLPRVADTRPEGRPVAATGGDSDHESAAHYLPKHLSRHSSPQSPSLSSSPITSSHRQPHHRHRHHHHLHHNQRHIHQNSSASVAAVATAPAANPRQHKLSAHIAHQNINSYVNNNNNDNNNNDNKNDNNFNNIVLNGSTNVRQLKTRASATVSVANPLIDLRVSSTRDFMLYSRCSQRYISFVHKKIGTTPDVDNSFALLSLEMVQYDNNLGIRIKSKVGGAYLCFNNRGRLTTKFDATNLECMFKEVAENRYIKFQSFYNQDWYIGFNRNGKSLAGQIPLAGAGPKLNPKRKKCYHFVKKAPKQQHRESDDSHEVLYNYDPDIRPLTTGGSNTLRHKPNGKRLLSPTVKHRLFRTNSNNNNENYERFFTNTTLIGAGVQHRHHRPIHHNIINDRPLVAGY